MPQFKGSKKRMLDFVESPTFVKDINALIKSTGAVVAKSDKWTPSDRVKNYEEEKLYTFLNKNFSKELSENYIDWWFDQRTIWMKIAPWSMLSTCNVDGKKGILLVVGRSNSYEMIYDSIAKNLIDSSSKTVINNHQSIIKALETAGKDINKSVKGVALSIDNCYKISAQVANAWWLAGNGVPVVLLYLGFLNVEYPTYKKVTNFKNDAAWQDSLKKNTAKIGVDKLIDNKTKSGTGSFTIISKSI